MLTKKSFSHQAAKETGYISRALDSGTSGLFTVFPSLSDGIVGAHATPERREAERCGKAADRLHIG